MELTLIQHGESYGNAKLPYDGPEPDLTARGHRQVRCAAERVRGELYDALYASCMLRALGTVCPLAKATGLSPRVWPRLAEQRKAAGFRGCPRSVLAARYPGIALPEECTEEGWWHAGAEDEAAAYARARRVLDALRAAHLEAGHRVLVVTHGNFGSALMSVLLGLPPCGYKRLRQHKGAFSRFLIEPDRVFLQFFNDAAHIPPGDRT